MATQPGLFDVEERLQRLSDIGDQLETALGYSDGAKGGRPPYDPVLMFKHPCLRSSELLPVDRG